MGGYTHTIDSLTSNPLPNRHAWSGYSAGFIKTVVRLPASATGQNIQLRWRCATDDGTGGGNWFIDSVSITTPSCCGNIVAPVITTQPTNRTAVIGENVTFNVGNSGTLPMSYQWRLGGTNLSAATNSSITRTNVQLSNTGAYSVVVSNAAGTATSSNAVLTVLDPNVSLIIARWDFNSLIPDGSTTTGTTTPAIGTGTALLYGGVSSAFATGSSNDTNTSDNSAWNTTTYPAQGAGNKTKGVQFAVSTAGRQNITVTFDERASSSANKYVRMLYTTNGSTFAEYPTANVMPAADMFQSKTNSLAGIPGVNNNPSFAFRLLSEFESTAITNTNANYVTAGGSPYSGSGTMRYDMVTVWGTPIPVVSPPISLSSLGYATNGQFHFTLVGATGFTWIVQASTDLSNWISLATNTVPFTFTDTNTAGLPQRFYRARFSQ